MTIIGLGLDILELADVVRLLEHGSEHFMANFTPAEQEYAGHSLLHVERLAGRFAAKEAVVKALGIGWGDGVAWTDIEVQVASSGAPEVLLHGRASAVARELGVSGWLVSISHTSSVAAAVVVALGSGSPR